MWFVFHACIVLGGKGKYCAFALSWEDDAILYGKSGCGYERGDLK